MNKNYWIIEVFKKKNLPDIFGIDIKRSIEEIGIYNVEEVRVSNIYKIECIADKEKIKKITKELLIDNVSETFRIYKKIKIEKNCWIVEVFLKEGVTDPVGDTARDTIIESGILKDVNVKTGKRYYIKGNLKEKEIKEICEKILANTLVQNYFIFKRV